MPLSLHPQWEGEENQKKMAKLVSWDKKQVNRKGKGEENNNNHTDWIKIFFQQHF